MLFIRINVNDETSNIITKERDKVNVSVIYNVFPKWKLKLDELDIGICYDSWVFIIVNQISWEHDS